MQVLDCVDRFDKELSIWVLRRCLFERRLKEDSIFLQVLRWAIQEGFEVELGRIPGAGCLLTGALLYNGMGFRI